MNRAFVAFVAFVVLAGCWPGARQPGARRPEPPRPLATVATLRSKLARAGITLEVRDSSHTVAEWSSCRDPEGECSRCDLAGEGDERFPETIDGIARAFARYPAHVVTTANLQRVAVCRTIRHSFAKTRRPQGAAFLDDQRIMISLEFPTGEFGEEPTEGIIHHELFHFLDWEISRESYDDDPEWSALNVAGFAYGRREEMVRGFVDHYAMKNVTEDRASVFEYLMNWPATCEHAADDPILAAKIQLLARRLAPRIELAFLAARAPCSKVTRLTDTDLLE